MGNPLELKVTNEVSASKPNTSIGDQLVESDEDEVELPDDETTTYMSSTGGGGFHWDKPNIGLCAQYSPPISQSLCRKALSLLGSIFWLNPPFELANLL
ncbi:hypothetical protein Tco_0860087 [Tanacetum coccineum]|uniref:Uncharacterized protein n=1 Tax=Tanacetum coccineum TaxID=301880 RepID=A0ABQ5BDW5_9ASTR